MLIVQNLSQDGWPNLDVTGLDLKSDRAPGPRCPRLGTSPPKLFRRTMVDKPAGPGP